MAEDWIKVPRNIVGSFIWGNANYLKLWLLLSFKALDHNGQVVVDNKTLTYEMNKGVGPSFQVSNAFVRYALNRFKEERVIKLSHAGSEYVITMGDAIKDGSIQEKAVVDEKTVVAASNPFLFYQQNGFGQISGFVGEDMQQWANDFVELGTSKQEANLILIRAMKIAVERNKVSWGYAKAILKDWCNRNLSSITAIEADQASHKGKAPSIKSKLNIDREYTEEDGIW